MKSVKFQQIRTTANQSPHITLTLNEAIHVGARRSSRFRDRRAYSVGNIQLSSKDTFLPRIELALSRVPRKYSSASEMQILIIVYYTPKQLYNTIHAAHRKDAITRRQLIMRRNSASKSQTMGSVKTTDDSCGSPRVSPCQQTCSLRPPVMLCYFLVSCIRSIIARTSGDIYICDFHTRHFLSRAPSIE